MLSIGEFSKICRCTTKTLRHYDRIGLLKPVRHNRGTGYRYYEISQLFRMLFIQKLKKYGFTLEEIKKLLKSEPKELKTALLLKQTQKTDEIEKQKVLLKQMKMDLWNLEKGIDIMEKVNIEIKLAEIPDAPILSLRENIAIENFNRLFGKVMDLLKQTGLECVGPPVAIYHSPEFDPENTDVEIGFPVKTAGSRTRVLKGGPCALAVHKGSYAALSQTYARLAEWVEEEGLCLIAPPYEKYLNSPQEVPEDQLVTEIYFPVKK
jgi:DNA-binding transcriptional MerR regulator